jgi:cytidylate kinase
MPGVTISAGYGAGGSVIAPRVADRLGFPLLDRAISSRVAEQLHVSVQEAEGGEVKRSLVGRFFGVLAPLAGGALGAGTDAAPPDAAPVADDSAPFRAQAETIMHAALVDGAVVLGRAGACALRAAPGVLRVRLFGPELARREQAQRLEHVDPETSARRLPEVDRARAHYVRRLYGCDIDDPALYDMQLDSTAIPLSGCVEAIVAAYTALSAASVASSQSPE